MSKQIIKQPNGKYCIYDTISESIEHENLIKREVLDEFEYMYEMELIEKMKNIENIIADIDKGKKPYYQFTRRYEEIKNKDIGEDK